MSRQKLPTAVRHALREALAKKNDVELAEYIAELLRTVMRLKEEANGYNLLYAHAKSELERRQRASNRVHESMEGTNRGSTS